DGQPPGGVLVDLLFQRRATVPAARVLDYPHLLLDRNLTSPNLDYGIVVAEHGLQVGSCNGGVQDDDGLVLGQCGGADIRPAPGGLADLRGLVHRDQLKNIVQQQPWPLVAQRPLHAVDGIVENALEQLLAFGTQGRQTHWWATAPQEPDVGLQVMDVAVDRLCTVFSALNGVAGHQRRCIQNPLGVFNIGLRVVNFLTKLREEALVADDDVPLILFGDPRRQMVVHGDDNLLLLSFLVLLKIRTLLCWVFVAWTWMFAVEAEALPGR